MSEEVKPLVTVVTGEMGVGKSYLTKRQLFDYADFHQNRGVLIFDPNDEKEYKDVDAIFFDVLEVMQSIEDHKANPNQYRMPTKSELNLAKHTSGVKKIAPYTKYKQKMSPQQLRTTMITILGNFRNGCILLDDVSTYIKNFEATEIEGMFKNIRHKSQDVILHLQSLNPMRPIHYEAASVIRMHYDGFSVDKIKNKTGNYYELLKIAQLIVENEYLQKGEQFFHLYVWTKIRKLKNITFEQFEKGCKDYLVSNPSEPLYKRLQQQIAFDSRTKSGSYENQLAAQNKWIEQRMHYFND